MKNPEKRGSAGRERTRAAQVKHGAETLDGVMAEALVINRLSEPLSEWALIDWWGGSALTECLNLRVSKSTKDRLYKTGDELFRRRQKIEPYLRRRALERFPGQCRIVLYAKQPGRAANGPQPRQVG